MDELGSRIAKDNAEIQRKRSEAYDLERQAKLLREEADELERLLELARFQR